MQPFTASTSRRFAASTIATIAGFCTFGVSVAYADVNTFTLRQPLNNATVRENVVIRVPRELLSQAGYATITIDGQFRGAPAIPATGDVVYTWDTKSAYETPDKPGVEQNTDDGNHTIVVDLYDKASNEIARGTSTVRVNNKIATLPDGAHLVYKWRPNQVQDFHITSDLKTQDGNTDVQKVVADFRRSVEDATGNDILISDRVLPKYSTITGNGNVETSPIASAFQLATHYWTVDKFGDVSTENHPLGEGSHFAFPVAQLPQRRIGVGDSWQTTMQVSLPWASEHLTTLHAVARLDAFEWQSDYPTAKVVETYDGPVQFNLASGSQTAATAMASGSIAAAGQVHITRTIWFAYEAGMLVRMDTNMTVNNAIIAPDQLAALDSFGVANDQNGMNPNGPAGMQPGYPGAGAGYPGGPGGGYPGGGGPMIPPYMRGRMRGGPGMAPMMPNGGAPNGYPGANGDDQPMQNGIPGTSATSNYTSTQSIVLTHVGAS